MPGIKDLHVGKLIAEQMRLRGYSYARMARELNLERSTIYSLVRQKSIDSDRLFEVSRILDYDFYAAAYQPLLHVSLHPKIQLMELLQLLRELEGEIEIEVTIKRGNW